MKRGMFYWHTLGLLTLITECLKSGCGLLGNVRCDEACVFTKIVL